MNRTMVDLRWRSIFLNDLRSAGDVLLIIIFLVITDIVQLHISNYLIFIGYRSRNVCVAAR
jgi:mannose/fructose/N-acetylgalactosamine-specific phosphotransferase system component IID